MTSDVEPDSTVQAADVARLLDFLRDRDVACPLCGYNLRDLTDATCPECRQELTLAVGTQKVRLGWFLVTITPSMFSGIAALFLMVPIIAMPVSGNGAAPWFVVAVDSFGWLSGIMGLVAIRHRNRFLRWPTSTQRLAAIIAWSVHVAAFLTFVALPAAFL